MVIRMRRHHHCLRTSYACVGKGSDSYKPPHHGLRDRPLKALAVYKGLPEDKEPLGVELRHADVELRQ